MELPIKCNGNIRGQENGESIGASGGGGGTGDGTTTTGTVLNGNHGISPDENGDLIDHVNNGHGDGANGPSDDDLLEQDDHGEILEPVVPTSEPLTEKDPMFYDIYPPHLHFVYHVEIGRILNSGLNKGQLELKIRTVIENNLDKIKTCFGRELREIFPELTSHVTTLRVYRERNTRARLADILANEVTSLETPSGTTSLNNSRQRLNSDSKSRQPLPSASNSPSKQRALKTKNEKSTAVPNSTPSAISEVVENEHNRCFRFHMFDLFKDDAEAEQIMQDQMDYEDEHIDPTVHSNHFILPRDEWLGLWDSLYFEDDTKERLFQYVSSALLFSAKMVDTTLIGFNKVIMLHGPPGCGKTTLCKALAQKCSVRFSHRYEGVQLLEVNSHSLFSKWFSESGKLVDKMFDKIFEMVHDQKYLIMLLIDEVESLAQCRQAAIHGFEPTDSIRAVNALLVNIDKLSQYSNVVVMATSNIVGGIDLAFLDRADLKMYLGPPPTEVVFGVLASSLNELLNSEILAPIHSEFRFPTSMHDERVKNTSDPDSSRIMKLINMAKMANGFSGRALRKICFLTHARFFNSLGIEIDTFLDAVRITIQAEMEENDRVNKQRNVSTNAPRLLATPQRNPNNQH